MTGQRDYLKNIETCTSRHVTFGDGVKGKIIGMGLLDVPGLPLLHKVLLVDNLKANLISISQLCDDDLLVQFTKDQCRVLDSSNKCVMEGSRSSDNCYLFRSGISSGTCLITREEESYLWHKRLGHINFRSLHEVVSTGAVRGLPPIRYDSGRICRECQIGKQTKSSHKVLQQLSTTHVLELLHMDLMGPLWR